MKASDLWPQRHPDYTVETNVPERLRGLSRREEPYCLLPPNAMRVGPTQRVIYTLGQVSGGWAWDSAKSG